MVVPCGSRQLFKLQGISSARGVLKSQPFQRCTRHRDKGGLVPVATGAVLSSTDTKSADRVYHNKTKRRSVHPRRVFKRRHDGSDYSSYCGINRAIKTFRVSSIIHDDTLKPIIRRVRKYRTDKNHGCCARFAGPSTKLPT